MPVFCPWCCSKDTQVGLLQEPSQPCVNKNMHVNVKCACCLWSCVLLCVTISPRAGRIAAVVQVEISAALSVLHSHHCFYLRVGKATSSHWCTSAHPLRTFSKSLSKLYFLLLLSPWLPPEQLRDLHWILVSGSLWACCLSLIELG